MTFATDSNLRIDIVGAMSAIVFIFACVFSQFNKFADYVRPIAQRN